MWTDVGLDAFTLSVESVTVNRLMAAVLLASAEALLTLPLYPDGENFFADRHAPDAALDTVLSIQEVLPIVPEFTDKANKQFYDFYAYKFNPCTQSATSVRGPVPNTVPVMSEFYPLNWSVAPRRHLVGRTYPIRFRKRCFVSAKNL